MADGAVVELNEAITLRVNSSLASVVDQVKNKLEVQLLNEASTLRNEGEGTVRSEGVGKGSDGGARAGSRLSEVEEGVVQRCH